MIVNGTAYPDGTDPKVVEWLETSRERKQRLRLWEGSEGRCRNEEYGTIGHVGRSCGSQKIPLLVHSSRSSGGQGIMVDSIIRIDTKDSHGKIRTVYKRDNVRFDKFVSTDIGTVYNETKGELYARCKSADAGRRLAAYMNGERWAK